MKVGRCQVKHFSLISVDLKKVGKEILTLLM